MRVLGPVVLAQTLLMMRAQPEFAMSGSVGTELVRDQHLWRTALLLDQLAQELQGRFLVAPGLDQRVEPLAFGIARPPQVQAPALDRDHHLVQMPRPRRFWPQPA